MRKIDSESPFYIAFMAMIVYFMFLCHACTIGGPCRKSPERLVKSLEMCERNYAELQDLCPEDISDDPDSQQASITLDNLSKGDKILAARWSCMAYISCLGYEPDEECNKWRQKCMEVK